jgi:uncharacterized protein (TIGR02680 family)
VTDASEGTLTVVAALTDRWRPSRAGLVALWRYWDETFTFHRGRLLLRGPNGSGKSMALELLLPFLLDADASPNRLTSAAKSRGGLYDRVMTGTDDPSRTGFAWVEFCRGDETFTVGARIQASSATHKAEPQFFTTTLAVGRDLYLLDGNRAPLTRKALGEAIGATGRVHTSADEYRTAVREALFPGFSADRYASVVGALLALRKERLSQHLDLAKLSDVLSEALPPIDEHDIAAVAEGFERLDRRKAELAALEVEVGEVRQLAARQRDYATAVVVSVAHEVRGAETRRDTVTKKEREAKAALTQVEAESEAAAAERASLADRIAAIGIDIEARKDSDAYREGAALGDLRNYAASLRQIADKAKTNAQEAADALERAIEEAGEAAKGVETATANLGVAERDLDDSALAVGAEAAVADARSVSDADASERLVRAWVDARRAQVQEIRDALGAHVKAVDARGFTEGRVADEEQAVADRQARGEDARRAERAAVAAFRLAVEDWSRCCETIGVGRVEVSLAGAADDPSAVGEALARLAAELGADDAVARRDLAASVEAAADERAGLLEERERWSGGGLVEPDGPTWRTRREGRAGAPLWRLVDLGPDLASGQVDGLEAALAGAGLLDAWVTPDGRVDLGADRADIVLGTGRARGRTLADVLVPVERDEAGVPAPVAAAVLRSVPMAETLVEAPGDDDPEVAVALDGTFRLGAAVGRGPLRPAMLLGSVARERHRLARLAAVEADIAAVAARLAELDRQGADLDRRRDAVAAELAAVPSGEAVSDARADLATAVTRVTEAEARLVEARDALGRAEAAVRDALRVLTAHAARHSLPTDADGLAAVEGALDRMMGVATTWARRRRDVEGAEREHSRAARHRGEVEQAAARAAADYDDSEREASEVEGRVAALDASVGAEYREVMQRIGELEEERKVAQQRQRELDAGMPALEQRVGRLRTELEAAETARAAAEDERARAQGRYVAVLGSLGSDAAVGSREPLDTASAVLVAARTVAADHERVDAGPQAVERLSDRVRERVHAAQAVLGGRVDVSRDLTEHGWWMLRTKAGGIGRGAPELAATLAAELEEGRAELAADEERLFEQTLAGSVRRALADRIRLANSLVDGINKQLDAVRTMAGGVQVRLRWEVDADQPDAVKAARSLLLRDPADLSDAEQESLRAFVRARVDQARAELEANAPWEARLRETLDYRSWHRFTLLISHRDWDGFQPATARRLQRLSTGERSIALHLPMIASVAAHYAEPDGSPAGCPRLILLDELFAGVDVANRAQLFGTFSAWDLDAVFTSDHEWCQYATLDGIAIHHLHPPVGDEPVTSTRFTWDGRRRLVDPPAA